MNEILTVSQLNRYVKSLLDGDFRLRDLFLRGEISNYTRHYRSGHLYFTLKEGGSAVKAVMFAGYAQELAFEPENGMAVILRCSVSLYERDGSYQIYVYEMQPDGRGALQVAFEQLYRKLQVQGLFDETNKKPIPRFAQRIGVVTSETGAALQDILNILSRRCPMAQVVFAPALVQGREAPDSLIAALQALDEWGKCDVIIIGRGGGSMEDLWCFNDERLVRQIVACHTPIISAVGHETDFTLCDYAADLRAPTPSAAAELASVKMEQLEERLEILADRTKRAAGHYLAQKEQQLQRLSLQLTHLTPERRLQEYAEKLQNLWNMIQSSEKSVIIKKQEALRLQSARLQALDPMARLAGGYSMVLKDGRVLSSVQQVQKGDSLQVRLHDGVLRVVTEQVTPLKECEKCRKNKTLKSICRSWRKSQKSWSRAISIWTSR